MAEDKTKQNAEWLEQLTLESQLDAEACATLWWQFEHEFKSHINEHKAIHIPDVGYFTEHLSEAFIAELNNQTQHLIPPSLSLALQQALPDGQEYVELPALFHCDDEDDHVITFCNALTSLFKKLKSQQTTIQWDSIGTFRPLSDDSHDYLFEPAPAYNEQLNKTFSAFKPTLLNKGYKDHNLPVIPFESLDEVAQQQNRSVLKATTAEPVTEDKEEVASTNGKRKGRKGLMILLIIIALLIGIAIALWLLKSCQLNNEIKQAQQPTIEAVAETNTKPQTADSLTHIEKDTTATASTNEPIEADANEQIDTDRYFIFNNNRTLASYARKYLNETNFWVYLYLANQDQINDPDHIKNGIKLRVPRPNEYPMDTNNPEHIRQAAKLCKQYK